MQVEDGARGFDQVAGLFGACGEAIFEEAFVFVHEMFQLAFLRCERVEFVNVEFAELLDVDGSALAVDLVIELGVVFDYLGLFGIVKAVTARAKRMSRSKEILVGVESSVGQGELIDTHREEASARSSRSQTTHAAMSSAPNSFLHFSLFSHMILLFARSNFLARKNRSSVVSSYLS